MPKKSKKRIGSANSETGPVKKTELDHFQTTNERITNMEVLNDTPTSCCEQDAKKSSKQKTDIKKAFRSIKSKLTRRKHSKNGVKEISIKPESDAPSQCWATDSFVVSGRRSTDKLSPTSSRSTSADSKDSKRREQSHVDDDGIPVIYDAAYHGGD